jgi:hypothetical protein
MRHLPTVAFWYYVTDTERRPIHHRRNLVAWFRIARAEHARGIPARIETHQGRVIFPSARRDRKRKRKIR